MSINFDNKWLVAFSLFLVLFLAFYLRVSSNSIDLIDSDSFYHARMVKYLIQEGSLPNTDPLAYYQVKGGTPLIKTDFFWMSVFILYKNFFGLNYNFVLFYHLLLFFPVFCGLIGILLIYLISRKLFDSKIGLISAFFAATIPSIIYRTSIGFFEDENIGVLFFLLSILFYVYALKENDFAKRIFYSGVTGFIIALTSMTWRAYILLFLIFFAQVCIGHLVVSISLKKKQIVFKELKFFFINSIVLFVSMLFGLVLFSQNLFKDLSFYLMLGRVIINENLLILISILLLSFVLLLSFLILNRNSLVKKNLTKLIPLFCYVIIGFLIFLLFFVLSKLNGSINSFIYEEISGFPFMLEQNGFGLFLIIITLIIFPLFIKFDSEKRLEYFFLFLILSAGLFMALYQLKNMLLFGVVMSIGIGFLIQKVFLVIVNLKKKVILKIFLKDLKFDKIFLRNILYFLLAIIIFSNLFYSFLMIQNTESVTQKIFGVKEASVWLKSNSDVNSKVFSWWDAGHLITFFGEKKVVCDNRNYFGPLGQVNQDVAEFFSTTDVNQGKKIIEKYSPNYIIIYPQLFTQLRVFRAYYKSPKEALDSKFNNNYYGFCERVDVNIICDGQVLVDLREDKSDYWIEASNSLIDGEEYYFYLGEDFYFMVDENTNQTNLAKIFFESEETKKYYKKVYSKNGTRIFKVLK
ncbi:MAG: STT3 domain-containing protein [Candidatus ainarchaeum sp.]|nr:STT3 domain-containing protein [Candidatus ainarchaeum sp.]